MPPTTNTVTIDARQFHCITAEISAVQDNYLMGQLRLAGALELLVGAKQDPDELKAEALLTQILVSGRAPRILAGCLTEVGKSWNYEEAERNARAFAASTDLNDKREMRGVIVGFVMGVCQAAALAAIATCRDIMPRPAAKCSLPN